jgi:hypothetical protein
VRARERERERRERKRERERERREREKSEGVRKEATHYRDMRRSVRMEMPMNTRPPMSTHTSSIAVITTRDTRPTTRCGEIGVAGEGNSRTGEPNKDAYQQHKGYKSVGGYGSLTGNTWQDVSSNDTTDN